MIIRLQQRPAGQRDWRTGCWYDGWEKFEQDCPVLAGFMKGAEMVWLEWRDADGARHRITVEEKS